MSSVVPELHNRSGESGFSLVRSPATRELSFLLLTD